MSREELIDIVKRTITYHASISLEGIELSTQLDQLGIDSLDMMKVAAALEETFNIRISTTELQEIKTLEDIVLGLEQKIHH